MISLYGHRDLYVQKPFKKIYENVKKYLKFIEA